MWNNLNDIQKKIIIIAVYIDSRCTAKEYRDIGIVSRKDRVKHLRVVTDIPIDGHLDILVLKRLHVMTVCHYHEYMIYLLLIGGALLHICLQTRDHSFFFVIRQL